MSKTKPETNHHPNGFLSLSIQGLTLQQQRSRIDQIMKLFPEQNGILMSSLQNHHMSSLPQQHQQVSNMPTMLSGQPVGHHNVSSRSHASKSINNAGYPMDCDPGPLTPNNATASNRYMMRCGSSGGVSSNGSAASYSHNHRGGLVVVPNYPLNTSAGSGGRSNNAYHAPSSLPIDIGKSMFGPPTAMDNSESSYQRHVLMSSGSASNLPQQLSTAAAKSGGTSGVNTAMTTNASRSNGNDRDEDSHMVGVCVQQSPVVIH